MTRRQPQVRTINMLSELHNPDEEQTTTAFYRALSEADEFIREHDRAAELECRCDELTQLVADIKALHPKVVMGGNEGGPLCAQCSLHWPCPTMKLIEGAA